LGENCEGLLDDLSMVSWLLLRFFGGYLVLYRDLLGFHNFMSYRKCAGGPRFKETWQTKEYQGTDGMWGVDPVPRRPRWNRDVIMHEKFKP
jgi:hypothetical protein